MGRAKKKEKEKAKFLLEKNILSQQEIAKYLGINEKTVTKWKRDFEADENERKKQQIELNFELSKINQELIEIKTLLKQLLK